VLTKATGIIIIIEINGSNFTYRFDITAIQSV